MAAPPPVRRAPAPHEECRTSDGIRGLAAGFPAGRAVGDAAVGAGLAGKDDHSPLLSGDRQAEALAIHLDRKTGRVVVPAQFLGEEGSEIEAFQALLNSAFVEQHGVVLGVKSSCVAVWSGTDRGILLPRWPVPAGP